MQNSSNLTSLPEDESYNDEDAPQSKTKSPSAFASRPDRPPIKISSQKYGPLDWSDYFDPEGDVHIPGSDNVFTFIRLGPMVLLFSASMVGVIQGSHLLCQLVN